MDAEKAQRVFRNGCSERTRAFVFFGKVGPKFTGVGVLACAGASSGWVGGWGGPTCRGCADGFICGGGGVANTTEGGCPGGNEGCKRQEQGEQRAGGQAWRCKLSLEKRVVFYFLKNFISNKNKPVVNLLLIMCIMSP